MVAPSAAPHAFLHSAPHPLSQGSMSWHEANSYSAGSGTPTSPAAGSGHNNSGLLQSLDLASTTASLHASALQAAVSIVVGGTTSQITSSTLLTPAERVALYQVLSTGQQSLILNGQGAADGGSLTIGSGLSSRLSSLVIPAGVTAVDVSKSGTLNLSGNLINEGTIDVVSTIAVLLP